MDIGASESKTYPLPLRLRGDTLKSIRARYPIEGRVLDLMVADGRAVLVDGNGDAE